MRIHLLSLVGALTATVSADVKITSPAAGATIPAGTIAVKWSDSSDSPSLSDLTTYTLQLMVGGNSDSTSLPLTTLTTTGQFSLGNTLQATIPAGLAGSTKNGFYLKMTSVAKEGGTVINFSDRFTLSGMTGTTPAQFVTAAAAVSGTDGPPTINQIANNVQAGGVAATGAVNGDYGVPYALQTGLTKYAPMQSVPPTKITLNKFTPLYSTSAYTVATTFLPRATILTTMTQVQTFAVSSIENTAAAQPNPTDDMARFLARWKD